jgi:hypothetical protein
MDLRETLWLLLAWGVLPLWLLAGGADWLCHRRTLIERTSGPGESRLHLLLYLEIAIPVVLALFLEITALLLVLMILGVAAHWITSWADTAFAQPRRHIAPIEQQVHSWLEMLPLFALVIVILLHPRAFAEADWGFRSRAHEVPGTLRTVILLVLTAGALPILEEWWRGVRTSRS